LPGAARYRVMPSTVIRSFAYDRAGAALDVTFVTGRRYRYFLVPPYIAEGMSEAFSKGRYFNARVRDRFPFEELEGEAAAAPARVASRGKGSRRRP
jgi:lysyl-tRNA synthetase class 2